jgi:hypothetical protein
MPKVRPHSNFSCWRLWSIARLKICKAIVSIEGDRYVPLHFPSNKQQQSSFLDRPERVPVKFKRMVRMRALFHR